jgi:hypothetical protein
MGPNRGEPVIDDDPKSAVYAFPDNVRKGLLPRDYLETPRDTFQALPSEMKVIPKSEWSDRIKEQEKNKARLSDLRNVGMNGQPIPYLDQGSNGYCWSHSTTHAIMVARAVQNETYVPLSAYAIAAIIKNGRDEGGWCGLSAKFAREVGVPSQELWPQGSRNLKYDTPAMRANAAKYKVVEDWVDLTVNVYDPNLTFAQVVTCLLMGCPCPVDFNWWGHSVCALDVVEVEPGSFGLRILNSWKGWGDNGCGILRGNKAIPDGAVSFRLISPSMQKRGRRRKKAA